jgi:hypothetical protein
MDRMDDQLMVVTPNPGIKLLLQVCEALQLSRHTIEQFIHADLEKRNFHGTDCAGLIRSVIIDAHKMQKRDDGPRMRAVASPLSTARIRVLFGSAHDVQKIQAFGRQLRIMAGTTTAFVNWMPSISREAAENTWTASRLTVSSTLASTVDRSIDVLHALEFRCDI